MTTLQQIKDNATYQQVLADSCGGLLYNVANQGTYDAGEVLALWDSLTPSEQSSAGGIMRGAMQFLKEE